MGFWIYGAKDKGEKQIPFGNDNKKGNGKGNGKGKGNSKGNGNYRGPSLRSG